MKFTLSWLKKHLDTTATLEALCEKLTAIGLEVESVEDRGAALAPFTVAYVAEAKQHPNADKLRVCQLDTKFGRVQVVCGAPNARTGMKGIFAPDGSTIPATGTVLKAGQLRGEASNGMLVSEREMGLSDEHNGIIEVPEHFAIGTPLTEVLGGSDPVIEIKLTPNRADCAGVRGVARDLAAAGLGTLKPLAIPALPGSFPCPLRVKIEDEKACPLFLGRVIRGVKNGPSPQWLQDALKAIGLRPISALVDITNYFTFDLCRPLHVFDMALVKGDTLTVTLSRGGETMAALNDKSYTLPEGVTVISDAAGVEALGGIVGGKATGCEAGTTDVFLEVALFDPVRTARTGRLLAITSDARYRFERGIDPAAMHDYAALATQMILEICGGEASELTVAGKVPDTTRTYTLRPDRVKTLGGVEVAWEQQVGILTTLGCTVTGDKVTPPSWRPDILGEADLVEEIMRLTGFDKIEALPLPRLGDIASRALSAAQRRLGQARRVMAGRGLMEAITWTFVSREQAGLFGQIDPRLVLLNPISSEMDTMRPSGLIGLLAASARNADHGCGEVALFESGPVFGINEKDMQTTVIAALRHGQAVPRQPQKGERMVDVFDAKADALAALEALGVSGAQVSADAPAWYHPGRSGCLRLGPTVVAHFGELHPEVLKAFGIKTTVVGCEVFVDRVPQPKAARGTAKPLLKLSPFQPVARDFAFVLAADVTADKVVKAIKGADRELIAAVDVFDDYRGKGVAENKKSLALSVTLQPREKTLTDAEIEAICQKIITAVTKATGGELRV